MNWNKLKWKKYMLYNLYEIIQELQHYGEIIIQNNFEKLLLKIGDCFE